MWWSHLPFISMSAVHIIFICFISFTGTMNSTNWLAPNVWVFIAQLVEHCSTNTEAMGSNPVEAPKTFFGLTLRLLKSQSELQWSHLHFITCQCYACYSISMSELTIANNYYWCWFFKFPLIAIQCITLSKWTIQHKHNVKGIITAWLGSGKKFFPNLLYLKQFVAGMVISPSYSFLDALLALQPEFLMDPSVRRTR